MRDKPRPGRPAEAVSPIMVANVKFFVNKDHSVILQEGLNQFSIGTSDFTRKTRYERCKCKVGAETADKRPNSIQNNHSKRTVWGLLTMMKISFVNVLLLGTK